MYTSFILQPVCVLLISQNWLLSIFWSVWIIFAACRINEEERLLIELFGGEYIEYKKTVGAFFPCKLFARIQNEGVQFSTNNSLMITFCKFFPLF